MDSTVGAETVHGWTIKEFRFDYRRVEEISLHFKATKVFAILEFSLISTSVFLNLNISFSALLEGRPTSNHNKICPQKIVPFYCRDSFLRKLFNCLEERVCESSQHWRLDQSQLFIHVTLRRRAVGLSSWHIRQTSCVIESACPVYLMAGI